MPELHFEFRERVRNGPEVVRRRRGNLPKVTKKTESTLKDADLSAFCALLRAQGLLGPSKPSPGENDFWAFFGVIDSFAYDHYRFITDPELKRWVDMVFGALLQTQTCYGFDAAGLYVIYLYAQFTGSCIDDSSGFPNGGCGHQGFPTDFEQRGGRWPTWDESLGLSNASPWNWFAGGATGLWKPPASPAQFFDALNRDVNVINRALAAAGHSIAAVALFEGWGGTSPNKASVQAFQKSRLDPANWTDSSIFLRNLAGTGLWQEQSKAVTAMLTPVTLNADNYLLLLHLLIALGTSTPSDQRLAQAIVSAITNSPEYPNDTFINQLVYLTLMHLADPMGEFTWTNAQLQAEVDLLAGVVTSGDPASQAINTSLVRQRRILKSDASYPMQDPYCPGIRFTQRKTDTLFALDRARQSVHQ